MTGVAVLAPRTADGAMLPRRKDLLRQADELKQDASDMTVG
jgi:hypothetical protein